MRRRMPVVLALKEYDHWIDPLIQDAERRDLLEILEERCGTRSTTVKSQLAPNLWHEVIGDSTLADPICGRLLHNGRRIMLLTSA